jgi:Ca2+-transporting ATPase
MARKGLRVLAVAGKQAHNLGSGREADEYDLTVYGLLGFQDPIRPEVPGAVEECQRAGIRIKMITGDHVLTAHAVSEAAGIQHEDDLIITGAELVALGEADRAERINRASIFARISPQQKFLMWTVLRRRARSSP